jgi:hypothetical protein
MEPEVVKAAVEAAVRMAFDRQELLNSALEQRLVAIGNDLKEIRNSCRKQEARVAALAEIEAQKTVNLETSQQILSCMSPEEQNTIAIKVLKVVLQDMAAGGYGAALELKVSRWDRGLGFSNAVLAKSGTFPFWPAELVRGQTFNEVPDTVLVEHPVWKSFHHELLENGFYKVADRKGENKRLSSKVVGELKNFVLVHFKYDKRQTLYSWCDVKNVTGFDVDYEGTIEKAFPNEKIRVTSALRSALKKVRDSNSFDDTVLGKRLRESFS